MRNKTWKKFMAGLVVASLAISVPAGVMAAERDQTVTSEAEAESPAETTEEQKTEAAEEADSTQEEDTQTEAVQEEDETEAEEVTVIEDEQVPLAAPEKKTDNAKEAKEASEDGLKVTVYTDETEKKEAKDTKIVLTGDLPAEATAAAWPVEMEDESIAYQLLILDKDGKEYHSAADDGVKITVNIRNKKLTKAVKTEKVRGWAKQKKEVVDMAYELLEDDSVQFEADEF